MKPLLSAVIIAALFPLAAQAALSSSDAAYLTSAMQSQLGRYALAVLAQKNGTSHIRPLAKSIAAEASAETRTLDAIAKRNGIAPPRHPGVRFNYHYSNLSTLHGSAFDRRFVQDLRIDDQIVSGNDQHQIRNGSDAQLRAFAKHRHNALQQEIGALAKLAA